MFITGKNNFVTLGHLIPNQRTPIESLKSFFYKTKKTEEEIKKHLEAKEEIFVEYDEVKEVKEVKETGEVI